MLLEDESDSSEEKSEKYGVQWEMLGPKDVGDRRFQKPGFI